MNSSIRPNTFSCDSKALAKADLSRAELLHPIDGRHASVEGHNVLADAAFSNLKASLEFLGI